MKNTKSGRLRPDPPSGRALDRYVKMVDLAAVTIIVALVLNDPTGFVGVQGVVPFLVFSGLLILGEVKPIKWLRLDNGGEVTMSWSFAFCLLLLGSLSGAVVVMALASVIGDLTRRKPLQRVLFNAAQLALSLGIAGIVLAASGNLTTLAYGESLGPLWFVSLAGAAAAGFLVNGALICIALALHEGTGIPAMLRRGLLPNLSTDGALLALAPCFLVISQRSLLLLPLILITATFVYRSSQAALLSEHAATHDVLTELLNRRAFTDRIDTWLGAASTSPIRGAVALIDLDGFKQINDRLGHHVGDQVLQEVGRRLIEVRRPGQIAARLGGDEFAILFTTVTSAEEAIARAHEIHHLIAQDVVGAGFPLAVGGSVGIALIGETDIDRETIMKRADLAMYQAKRNRTGVELYSESNDGRDNRGRGRLGLISDLGGAIGRDELVLHYQPQFDLATGELFGVEALLRWNHPRLGLVAPSDFMPLAEHTELMGPITEYVLTQSLATWSAWQQRGVAVRFAINVSAHNLQDLRFPDVVAAALEAARAPAAALEIEITENTVMADPERAHAVLAQLKVQDIRVALDDFGTGYSSLTNLRDLPIDAIKIDRSFVEGLATDQNDREIVRTLIELAHALRLEVTAEGVEDEGALAVLTSFGCDSAQGFLLGRPAPGPEVLELVLRHRSANNLREAS